MTSVYLSLGSNIGDRKDYLMTALNRIKHLPNTSLKTVSSLYETTAWGKTDQDDFLNCCCKLETSLSPQELLLSCQKIERDLNRIRHEHWGPRTLDIDILLYGDDNIATDQLQIPHPYMTKRAFVLVPLAEIAPELCLYHKSIRWYLSQLKGEDVRKLND